eukprot:CAMPEP_0117000284 /NCGR_PEP_ID=MMETSP0472-20121206/2682_1 /TAXON_ID=693140 ORGANISM="Tiarina fusus, Strain LIS" /NCGR_SAMPLE_ID=MMETSP0472 /ASSEMBLY_ACC=CAM_ASM_000603 /LENGTH=289 /DNA_ID=CAMNT_0004699935 /DNA_START=295 /DNA_END=1161 /DNA_ORIENTATION=-
MNIIEDSQISITAGNVEMYDNGNVNMNSATISVSGVAGSPTSGSFKISDQVRLSMVDSFVRVDGGDFNSNGFVFTDSISSIISVSKGSATFTDSSEYRGVSSEIQISGGDLNISGTTVWSMFVNSRASVSAGSLNLADSSKTSLENSSFDVSGGNFNLFSLSDLSLASSSLTVTGGDLYHADNSHFIAVSSTISISEGRIIYDDNSLCEIENTQTTVALDRDGLTSKLPSPMHADDLMIFGGQSIVHFFSSSVLDILRGNFAVIESATAIFDSNSRITVSGGNMEIRSS